MSQKKEFAISMISHGGIGATNEKGETVRNLTGSCHELAIQYNNQLLRILVDVGGYQGTGNLERDIKRIAKGVKAIVLTHPHMDHIGELATLYHAPEEEQYSGKVLATQGTKKAAYSALTDAAKIIKQKYDEALTGGTGTLIKKIEEALHVVENYEKRNQGVSPIKKGRSGRLEETSEPTVNTRYTISKKFLEPYKELLKYDDWKKIILPEPAFTQEDVGNAVNQIETHSTKGWKEIIPGKVSIRFYNAGHIIGSTSVLFKIIDEKRKPHYVLFTGDVGSYKWDLHINGLPEPPNNLALDAVIIESTYGGRVRDSFEKGREEFETSLINAFNDIPDTAEQKGRKAYNQVILSCFSLDRLQNILFRVVALKKAGKINVPIYVDSPLGIEYIQAYLKEAEHTLKTLREPKQESILQAVGKDYIEREKKLLEAFIEYLNSGNLNYIPITSKDARDRLMQMESQENRIIITASGMANGGPVMSYLASFAGDSGSAFYFPGYLAEGTLGCQLAGEAQMKRVRINGTEMDVQARMKNFTFLSGHADEKDLILFLESLLFRKDSKIIVVHGDKNRSSASLANTIMRQIQDAPTCIVPDIDDEIQIQGNGISKTKYIEKGPSRVQLLIKELGEALHIQNLLLSEKIKEAKSTTEETKEGSPEPYTLEDTDSQNLEWEIQRIQRDVAKLTGTINRLQSFKSDDELSLSFLRTINERYRYKIDTVLPTGSRNDKTIISTPRIQIKQKRVPASPITESIAKEEGKKEEQQESKFYSDLQELIKTHNDDATMLMDEIRASADRDGIADLRRAKDLIGKLKELQQSLNADKITLVAMNRAQERRTIDEIPAMTKGAPTDKRKMGRLSRLKSDERVYENASKIAIESLKERMGITEEEIEEISISLRDSVGAFRSAEEISSFLMTGKIPARKKKENTELQQTRIQGKINNLRELEKQLEEERNALQVDIENGLSTLTNLQTEKDENDAILKRIPEYIESLLQGLKRRMSQLRKELSELEEIDKNILIIEEEIGDIARRLTRNDLLMEQLEDLGIAYFPKSKNKEGATYEIYMKKGEDAELGISKIQKEMSELRRGILVIDTQRAKKILSKGKESFIIKQEEKKGDLQRKLEDSALTLSSLEQEVTKIHAILESTPEHLKIKLKQQEKTRGQLLEQKKRLESSGLTPKVVIEKEGEIKKIEKMIDLLSGRFSQKAEFVSFLKKSGIVYISEVERKIKNAARNLNPEEKEIESTYTIYMNKRKEIERGILQTGGKVNALKKDIEQLQGDVAIVQEQLRRLENTPLESHKKNIEGQNTEESFWLPQVSKVDINQGIDLALIGILERIEEYQEFKRNLTKIRGSDISDISMTEKEFSEIKEKIKKLHERNEELRSIIKEKIIQHFAAREVANQK